MANEFTRSVMANLSGREVAGHTSASVESRLTQQETALLRDVMGGKAPAARPAVTGTALPEGRRLSLAQLAQQKRQGR